MVSKKVSRSFAPTTLKESTSSPVTPASSTAAPVEIAPAATDVGERRVRLKFNPSGDALVEKIKQKSADLINICAEANEPVHEAETKRLWALAQTAYEEAAMWAVKAATA
jgi:hypothetical protein